MKSFWRVSISVFFYQVFDVTKLAIVNKNIKPKFTIDHIQKQFFLKRIILYFGYLLKPMLAIW